MYTRDTELRKMHPVELEKLAQFLEPRGSWRNFIALVRDEDRNNEMLFTSEHVRMIEKESQLVNKLESQIFLEEWITLGKKRPTIGNMIDYLAELGMFRAADYLTVKLLKSNPEERPMFGPPANVQIDLDDKEPTDKVETPPQSVDPQAKMWSLYCKASTALEVLSGQPVVQPSPGVSIWSKHSGIAAADNVTNDTSDKIKNIIERIDYVTVSEDTDSSGIIDTFNVESSAASVDVITVAAAAEPLTDYSSAAADDKSPAASESVYLMEFSKSTIQSSSTEDEIRTEYELDMINSQDIPNIITAESEEPSSATNNEVKTSNTVTTTRDMESSSMLSVPVTTHTLSGSTTTTEDSGLIDNVPVSKNYSDDVDIDKIPLAVLEAGYSGDIDLDSVTIPLVVLQAGAGLLKQEDSQSQ